MKIQAAPAFRRFRTALASFGVVAALGAAACATQVDSSEPDPAAQPAREQDAKHFRGPVGVVVDAALAVGNLSAEQASKISAIGEEMRFDREDRKEMGNKLKGSAVEIVRTGTADSEQFDAAVKEATDVIKQHMADTADALEEVHLLLDSSQRSLVAAELRRRIIEKYGAPRDETRERSGFKRIAAHLMLSATQIDKLKLIRERMVGEEKRFHPTREELLALVDAFEGNEFRPAVDAFHAERIEILQKRLANAGEDADAVLSLLTPGQRDLLADLIQRGPRRVLIEDQQQQRQ